MSRAPEDLLVEALALAPGDRMRFLRAECGADGALFDELRSLLDAYEGHPDLLLRHDRAAEPATLPRPGDMLGPYRIEDELGRGGAGVVYGGTEARGGRRVALKVLRPGRMATTTLDREARLLATLRHPCVCAIHTAEHHAGFDVLCMERVQGRSLAAMLDAGPLPTERGLRLGRHIAMALEAAHARGVLHLDLKPTNVVVDESRDTTPLAKVLDFGIGRLISSEQPAALLGSPGYASPGLLSGDAVGPADDVWGLGCVLYEMMAGTPAFAGASTEELVRNTLEGEPDWVPIADAGVAVLALVQDCLDPDPTRRLPDAGSVRQRLTAILSHRTGGGSPRPRVDSGHVTDAFVGRQLEREHLHCLIDDDQIVTLVGPGGIGKSRLAAEVLATRDVTRVETVDLAGVDAPELVLPTVARVLGVRERRDASLLEGLVAELHRRPVVLTLDNCEHVRRGCVALIQHLADAGWEGPLLSTSRLPFDESWETVMRVAPLAVARADAPDAPSDATRLLLDRLQAAGVDIGSSATAREHVAAITRRLDGIPLAIELAARRIARSLADAASPLPVLTALAEAEEEPNDARDGSAVLDAAIAANVDLLAEPERRMFRSLSVFRGGFALESARAVANTGDETASLLLALVDASLVQVEHERVDESAGGVRYRLLEPVRAFATRQLEAAGDTDRTRGAHRDHFAELAIELSPRLRGADQDRWLVRLDEEVDNVRAALADFDATTGDPELALRMTAALGQYWLVRGMWTEGRRTLTRVTRLVHEARPTVPRVNAVTWLANLAFAAGALSDARQGFLDAHALGLQLDDDELVGRALANLGAVQIVANEFDEARRSLEDALERQRAAGLESDVAATLLNLGVVAERCEDYAAAESYYEESLTIRRELGDPFAIAASLNNLGTAAEKQDRLERAIELHEEAASIRRRIGDERGTAESLHNLAAVAARLDRPETARRQFEESLQIRRRIGDLGGIATTLEQLAALLAGSTPELAVEHLVRAEAWRAHSGVPATPAGASRLSELWDDLTTRLGAARIETIRTRTGPEPR